MLTAKQQSNGGKTRKGIRKDAISHGLYASVMEAGGFPAYFAKLLKLAPTKHADLIAKYIPAEIEHTGRIEQAHTLNVILPEPRREIASNVRELDVIDVQDTTRANGLESGQHKDMCAGLDPQPRPCTIVDAECEE